MSEPCGRAYRQGSAELAVVGARVRTLDPAQPWATSVACADGRIVAVGSDSDVRAHIGRRTEVIDGRGTVLTPGLVDAHIHPFLIEETRGLDLTRCATLADLEGVLARERNERGPNEWLLGWGLEYGVFAGREIGGAVLAAATGDAPVFITFMDQHTAVASPRALELAHVSGREAFGDVAAVVSHDGTPTGELRETGPMMLVRDAVPPLSANERRARAVATLRQLNAVGLTGAHVMNGDPDTFGLLRDLESAGELTLRLVVPLWQRPETTVEAMTEQLSLCGEHGRLWRGGVAKFFIDGVIDSGTAWLYDPDRLGCGTEPFWPDPDFYAQAVRLFAEAGFQCVTHAVGDRAVRAALDAYASAERASAPHRVEHIETLQPQDRERFAAEGVAASMQPLHMQWRKPDGSDSWASRLDAERIARAFPVRDLLDRGTLVALGSDWPVAQFDPRIGMAWARLRRTPGEPDAEPFEPAQRISAEQALHGYTTACSQIIGEQSEGGTIAVGMRADLTAFGGDPVEATADELVDLPIRLTVVDGAVVHSLA